MRHATLFPAVAALSVLAIPPLFPVPVSANDRKSHAATLCTSASPTSQVAYQQEGHIENSTAASVTATCPILRDNVATSQDVAFASVWLFDSTPLANVRCTLYSRSESGAISDSETVASSGSSGTIVEKTFAMPMQSVVSGYYFMSCTIPAINGGARSGVVNYVIDEQ